MEPSSFGKDFSPLNHFTSGVPPLFGNPPTRPASPPVRSSVPALAPAPAAPVPQPRFRPPLQPVSPQPWQLPQRFGTHGMQLLNERFEAPKKMWSTLLTVGSRSAEDLHSPNQEAQRDASPHLVSQRPLPNDSTQHHSDAPHSAANDGGASSQVLAKFQGPKRIRSPPLPSANVPIGVSSSDEINTEREMQAKAKRLARFHVELSQPAEGLSIFSRKTFSGSKENQIQPKKVKFPDGDSATRSGDSFEGDLPPDHEVLESYHAICGLCLDMCPESEREERERKGDLDKYERLDGERHQTSISLSVKKYNRTAERDADLIRPLPVLRRTVDYLLDLLNQPYDEQFLGLYNFLWDRMRAVRMDLRMQHIFNQDAIHMLEQMIRLHIIAMHELSENKKGEGFSDGFDAHLNIEQMNKTSVELFQMYDDHRKKGSIIPTEREFRGYYALLKLDKHPGYRVEPSELSLDLAKMTPEIRCASEILFARDVARACRTSNFIAFFRLARRATYLQACLMHAHFSKLRTLALASLHTGLQSNQGIPVAHVVKWLAMEGEDIESLLEYHGFAMKRFEELYMVKEGPFLNSDVDYPTKCSQLVKSKSSKRIVDDVCHGHILLSPAEGRKSLLDVTNTFDQRNMENGSAEAHVDAADGKMLDYQVDFASTCIMQPQTMFEEAFTVFSNNGAYEKIGDVHSSRVLEIPVNECSCCHSLPSDDRLPFESGSESLLNEVVASDVTEMAMQVEVPGGSKLLQITEDSLDEQPGTSCPDGGELTLGLHENETATLKEKENETARARLKLILRTWKRRSSKKREVREQKQLLADAALSSLSLGPPIRKYEVPTHAGGDLNIDHVVRERYARHEKSWSRLNVSEVVAPILSTRNPLVKCLFWKLALCLQINDDGNKANQLVLSWLLWKLMGTGRGNDGENVISSSNLSVWKKSVNSQAEVGFPQSWCYSVVREVAFDKNMQVAEGSTMVGLSAVMFLVSESIPWAMQKLQLHKVLVSIPSGSSLPLLILSSGAYKAAPDSCSMIIDSLGLQYLDKTIIKDYSIVFLDGNEFFSDDHLRDGLQWLAENSPLQPCLQWVKTRDLVWSFLNSWLTALENRQFYGVGPEHCITVFNEALNRSTEEICFAAEVNKNCWPGPEIGLLKDLPSDSYILNVLPSGDWSNPARIEPLVTAISNCKLPSFSDDLSWLNQGSEGGSDIISQKLALEQALLGYLTNIVGHMGGNLAAKEASAMLQNGAGLQLRGERYYIIPRWVTIFRRIYHWRLTNLFNGKFASAYVLESGIPDLAEPNTRRRSVANVKLADLNDSLGTQGFQQLQCALTQLSLDELIQVSCITASAGWPPVSPNGTGLAPGGSLVDGVPMSPEVGPSDVLGCNGSSEPQVSPPLELNKETERTEGGQRVDNKLNVLLEKCNRLQNMIDEKLAIYF